MLKKLVGIVLALGFVAACSGGIRAGNPGPPPGRADEVLVTGRLVGGADSDKPVPNQEVRLEGPEKYMQTTDTDGRFTFDAVTTGTYKLKTWVGDDDVGGYAVSITEVEVGKQKVDLGDLPVPGALRGRVTLAGSGDFLGTDVFVPGTSFLAKTDANGDYLLLGILPGTYTVVASRYGFDTARVNDVAVSSAEVTVVPDMLLTKGNVQGVAPTLVSISQLDYLDYREVLTLAGSNFGTLQGDGKVLFSGVAAPVISWSDTLIKVSVPAGLEPGMNTLYVTRSGLTSNAIDCRVRPWIDAVSSEVAGYGVFVVEGENFGSSAGALRLYGPGDRTLVIGSWSSTVVTAVVPPDLPIGQYTVQLTNELSALPNRYTEVVFAIDSVSPVQFSASSVFTVSGTNFSPTITGSSLTIGGKSATIDTWEAERIVGRIAADAEPGLTGLELQIGGRTVTSPVTVVPMIADVRGEAGSYSSVVTPGSRVRVHGANFGTLAGTATLSGMPVTVETWSSQLLALRLPTGVSEGAHALALTIGSPPVVLQAEVVIDATTPDTIIVSAPPSITMATQETISFMFADDSGVSGYECRLDAFSWATCSSPTTLSALGEGFHEFAVRAIDLAGNVDPTPATTSWTVDLTDPQTWVADGPPGVTTSTEATFIFNGSDDLSFAGFECRLDSGVWEACSSPRTYSNLSTTVAHTFWVRSVDEGGNRDPSPATWSWYYGSQSVVQVAAGQLHTCAVTNSGGVKCWGENRQGQLGDGTYVNRGAPVDVIGLSSNVTFVAVGRLHSCAVLANGEVKCWGDNFDGQLGDGTTCPDDPSCNGKNGKSFPVDVVGLNEGARMVSAGGRHTCTVTVSGAAFCWGNSYHGNLGTGTGDRLTPTAVVGLDSGVKSISAGYAHTCAVMETGGAKCWGPNVAGKVGAGTLSGRYDYPEDVTGLTFGVAAISAGVHHTCALTDAGGVKCWGNNERGQLGNGSLTMSGSPVDVSGFSSGVTAVATGNYTSCAQTTGGQVACWGANDRGQLGNGTMTNKYVPAYVSGFTSGVLSLASRWDHSCATKGDGTLACWGSNLWGQLGHGWGNPRVSPAPVSDGWTSFSLGGYSACAIKLDGTLWCWGYGGVGGLGLGDTEPRSYPEQVGTLTSWKSIDSTVYHSLAPQNDGSLWGWGDNRNGELGTTQPTTVLVPIQIGTDLDWKSVSAGNGFSCGLKLAGELSCWGVNADGQLGIGSYTATDSGTVVTAETTVWDSVSAGWWHACAIDPNGRLFCWGRNYAGELGIDDDVTTLVSAPARVGSASDWASVDAGQYHTCALKVDGTLWCWGNNSYGQLGNGTIERSYRPLQVGGASDWVRVSAGNSHTCALKTDGYAWCWGNGAQGALGTGEVVNQLTPTQVLNGYAWLDLGASLKNTCAVRTDNRLFCWGDNSHGQLGDGSIYSLVPISVVGF